MTKVIVTGGAGFIGSHLVDALVEKGFDVHIIDDLSGGKKEVINIGTGKNHTINMFAQLVGGEIVYVPARLEAQNSRADATKAKKLLNWEPQISLEQGIAELKSLENIVINFECFNFL